MFNCVRHTWHVRLIAEVAHIDIHGSTCLIRVRIVHQQRLQLVR
jgi:hypothetical protein